MSAPTLGLSKKPSLTQEREKLERDQVFETFFIKIILVVYTLYLFWVCFCFELYSSRFSPLIIFIFVLPNANFLISEYFHCHCGESVTNSLTINVLS